MSTNIPPIGPNGPDKPGSGGPRPASSPRQAGKGKKTRRAMSLLIGFALLSMVAPIVVGLYTDFAWFGSIDYQGMFIKVLLAKAASALVCGLLSWLFFSFVFRRALAASRRDPDHFAPGLGQALKASHFALIVPLVLAIFPAMAGWLVWREVLSFVNAESFGVTDPQFGKDLGFYAFQLPLLTSALGLAMAVVAIGLLASALIHYLVGSITLGNPRVGQPMSISVPARRQLGILAAVWMLLKAGDYWLDRYHLMGRQYDTFTGAGYTDVNALLPAKIVLLVVSIFVAIMFIGSIVLRDLRLPALAVALMVGTVAIVGVAWPLILEQFSVAPNRAEKEREYIARNIESTRFAYNIGDDTVTYVENWGAEPAADAKAKQSVGRDSATISNIRLLDPSEMSPTFTQQQQLKNFYGFPRELNVDRYQVDGKMRDFVVAARELNPNTLEGNQNDWINRHTVFTHGNGFVAAPANKVDEVVRDAGSARGGYPVYTVADLQSNESGRQGGELKLDLKQPRIYYGPLIASSTLPNSDYAIVGAAGEGPVEYDTDSSNYTYTGTGGVPIGNWINRAAFSLRYESMKMLLTDRIGPESKILFERDPRERVHKVAPWLTTDSKTYPIVDEGRIKWVVDGYTTLANLPYSQRTSLSGTTADSANPEGVRQSQVVDNEVAYIRNSVKAIVDSYDGSVDLYAFDDEDPVLKVWMKSFPDVVKPKSEISDNLMNHLRYPEDMFKVQRQLIARYHVSDPAVFFKNDAFWSVPGDPTANENRDLAQPPYYVVATAPESTDASFQLITPFRGLRREFLSAHMSASSDPDTYGKIYVRVLPTDKQTQGPKQAQDTMMSSDEVARERTLLEGSNEVINGNLLTLPVGDGQILYVEPVFSKRKGQQSAFPKLIRVLVSYNGQVGYAPTIAEALSQVGIDPAAATDVAEAASQLPDAAPASDDRAKGAAADGAPAPSPAAQGTAEQRVRDAMAKVRQTRESGTFEEFGRALDELDRAVADLQNGGAS